MPGTKSRQARQQPSRRKGRQHRDPQRPLLLVAHALGCRRHLIKHLRQFGQIGRAFLREAQRMASAREHGMTQPVLQLPHLMADRRLRDAELSCGQRKAHMPRSGLKGAQRAQRWQTAHVLD
ncbi:hypothetical protein G6F31_021363 [Rhizopus arrhizus]|nr:hypothetical protein G6F31_021363 [Rhizopus arrhizus]